MATNKIAITLRSRAALTKTLASLAAGSSRQTTMVSNTNNDPAALVFVKLRSGAVAPTAGRVYEIYLLRGDGTNRTDGAGATDAAITIENAPLLGTIVVTATTAKDFYGEFDTAPLGPLGAEYGIAVKNATDQALDATESNHVIAVTPYIPDIQAAA